MKPEVFLQFLEKKKHLVGLILFAGFAIVLTAYILLQSPPKISPVTGKLEIEDTKPKIPDFTFEDESNKQKNLYSYEGKVVLLSFWASWCAPCHVELPMFQKLQEDYDDDDFVIVPVNLDDVREDAVSFKKMFWKKHDIEFPTYYDPTKSSASMLDVQGLPANFLLNKKMQVVFESTGLQDWNSPEVRKLIDELL